MSQSFLRPEDRGHRKARRPTAHGQLRPYEANNHLNLLQNHLRG
jgi:hypothetical protein